jgi:hypothetical protein
MGIVIYTKTTILFSLMQERCCVYGLFIYAVTKYLWVELLYTKCLIIWIRSVEVCPSSLHPQNNWYIATYITGAGVRRWNFVEQFAASWSTAVRCEPWLAMRASSRPVSGHSMPIYYFNYLQILFNLISSSFRGLPFVLVPSILTLCFGILALFILQYVHTVVERFYKRSSVCP